MGKPAYRQPAYRSVPSAYVAFEQERISGSEHDRRIHHRPGGRISPGTGDDTIDVVGFLSATRPSSQLDSLLAEAAWRRGRLVVVRGEAGIGKTTLVNAFTAGRSGRVLWGMCDPVVPPRALAPIFDIAEQVGGELRSALADPDRHRIITAFLGLLRAEGGPWIVVLEDVQWADEATLELLRVVGRRTAQLRALVIATVRDDEVGPDHPLSAALGDVPAGSMVSLRLPPLSVAAVQELAAGTTIDPIALHRATAGNPFFVAEVLAGGGRELPSTVRDAVWARARRLSPAGVTGPTGGRRARPALQPPRSCARSRDAAPAGIDECVAGGILRRQQLDGGVPPRAVPASRAGFAGPVGAVTVAPASAGRLARPRTVGRSGGAGPPRRRGGRRRRRARTGPKAAARAAALGAHRAALAHYQSALPYAARLPGPERASLLAAHAHECFVADDINGAIASQERSRHLLA